MKILLVIFICTLYAVLNVTGAALIKNELIVFSNRGQNPFRAHGFYVFSFPSQSDSRLRHRVTICSHAVQGTFHAKLFICRSSIHRY